jgi:hypothetical protein
LILNLKLGRNFTSESDRIFKNVACETFNPTLSAKFSFNVIFPLPKIGTQHDLILKFLSYSYNSTLSLDLSYYYIVLQDIDISP